jgi:protein-S-isoprenylcysteine O-methyltransferase Ste14
LVIVDTALILIFAASFYHPQTKRDWKAFGVFSAFIVALFTEMYGYPLTVYLLSSWLGGNVLGLDLTHNGGHLWVDLFGWKGDPHLSPFHIASYFAIIGGFWLIAAAWRVLYAAQRRNELARSGPYAWVLHPQYSGFLLIMVGFLLQWPTIPTLVLFPILVLVYRRLAIREEAEIKGLFGREWERYAGEKPRFVPRYRGRSKAARSPGGPYTPMGYSG